MSLRRGIIHNTLLLALCSFVLIVRCKSYRIGSTDFAICYYLQHIAIGVEFPEIKGGKSLNRWLPLVKWFLSIPLILVGLVYSVIALGMTFIAWIMTSATGNYPKWAGKFVFKTIRFWNRVNGYAFILVSDKYPSFGL